jgi:hypothetical protein
MNEMSSKRDNSNELYSHDNAATSGRVSPSEERQSRI